MKSIQSKILSVVILGILIVTIAVSAISVYTANKIMQNDADIIIEAICQREAALLNDILGDIQKSVHIMGEYALSELESADQLTDDAYLEKYTDKMTSMFLDIAANTEGAVAYYLRFNPDITTPTAGFFISADSESEELVVFEPTDLSMYEPDDTEHVGWYYAPVNAGEPIWMSPYYNRNNDILMVSYVVPLYKNNTLIGVVGMDIDFLLLTETVENISVYENGSACLVGSDGNTIYNQLSATDINSDVSRAQAMCSLANGMSLKIFANYNDIQKESYAILTLIIIAFVVILVIFVIYTVIVTNRIILPLKRLTVAARHLADGKTDVNIDYDSDDEVGTLSQVFNKTAQKLQEYMSYINALAYRDSLTGIKNRTAYDEEVAEIDEQIKQGTSEFAVLVADTNDLKAINDTYGHDIGNEIIISAANMLCEIFKRSPVFRIGGDEFVVILKNKDYSNYETLVRDFDTVCNESFIKVGENTMYSSIARGVAVFDPEKDQRYEDVFSRADSAMYSHKQKMKTE